MKQFFKFFTASCLGVFAAICLLFFVIAMIGVAAGSSKTVVANKSVLKLDFNHGITELSDNIAMSPYNFSDVEAIGLQDIKNLIEYAATDDRIKGIYLDANQVSAAPATLDIINKALIKFKESNKFIYSYADYYSQSGYYLASSADSIYLNLNGSVDLKGFGTVIPYFKKAMDAVGVDMDIFYAGNFKSATEPYRSTKMSENNRIQTKEFLTELWNTFKNDIAINRKIDNNELDKIVNEYRGNTAQSALGSNLVDRIAYQDEVEFQIKKAVDVKPSKKIEFISLTDYKDAVVLPKTRGKQKIAVVYMEGEVSYGSDENGTINENRYPKLLEKIEADTSIKAVVLRINSGGGSSLTSDIIWHHVENIKKSGKHVVASFGDYAASGGYYVACGADTIVAMPNTLTGSIGVFMMLPNIEKLLTEKIGITFDTVKTAPMAASFQTVYPLSDQEKQILTNATNEIYEQFLNRVSRGRGMTRDAVHEVAQGRVWTGSRGKELGLVDELGDLDRAIEIAAEMAHIDKYSIKTYPKLEPDPVAEFIKNISNNNKALSNFQNDISQEKLYKMYQKWKPLTQKGVQMRLPYYFEWN